jgi:hypothetical protein
LSAVLQTICALYVTLVAYEVHLIEAI